MKLRDDIQAKVNLTASAHGLDKNLLTAIIQTESAGNPWAVRYEPNWKYFFKPEVAYLKAKTSLDTERTLQACSWGLVQIMGSVARELGYTEELPKLCQEDVNILYGAKKLASLSKKHQGNDLIASYNAGQPRIMSNGKYFNQAYVDKVNAFLKILKG